MQPFLSRSTIEQLANHLREQILSGHLSDTMPGVNHLVNELGVGTETVISATRILEKEGWLVAQGPRQRRKIVRANGRHGARALQVGFLLYEQADNLTHYLIDLRHQLTEAGHTVHIAPKSQRELDLDSQRIARLVEANEMDAWVVIAGSLEVLEWFASQPAPAFALFGRLVGVPLASASPKKAPAFAELVARLAALGHRRIVMLSREERRKPTLGFLEQFFLDQLEAHGIKTGIYNMPDWEDSPEDLQQALDSLFKHTPPTALIIAEPSIFHATRDHLAHKGILAPEHVSLICSDDDPTFAWSRPHISCIRWDSRPIVRRVLQWANNIAMGKSDLQKMTTAAKFIHGGTIGPVNRQP